MRVYHSPTQPLNHSTKRGFTLVEMAIIIVIIGLIASMIVPAIVKSIKRDRLTNARRLVRIARDEIVGYAVMNGKLPSSPDQIGHGEEIFGKGTLFYRPASNLLADDSICSQDNSTLSVILGSDTRDNVAFVIASKGENFNLQLGNNTDDVTIYEYGQKVDDYPEDVDRPEPYDDIVEYVTLGYLKQKICTSASGSESGPLGADISFAQNMDDFVQGAAIYPRKKQSITVVQENKTINLGNGYRNAYGCYWYSGDSGPCNNGNCTFGNGVRVFFKFRFADIDSSLSSKDFADGFTFALISAANNDCTVCGKDKGYLGYAGDNGVTEPVRYPKMAVEVDTYPDGGFNDYSPYNHVSLMYWGEKYEKKRKKKLVEDVDDDVTHGAGDPDKGDPKNNEYGDLGYYNTTQVTWLEDAMEHTFRLEVDRNATSGDFQLRAWVDCIDCSDLTSSYNGTTPTIQDSVTISNMDYIIFGWTQSTRGKTQNVTISDFGIKFL
ncbi:prepilin-type N-terminal cleavage/methylation domain-containing protein [Desulfohalobiaceae bacterium Ax17]|uniref:prepilin-type N-terminal cleavage/methylation domain-containing protein n=1 Tax=Desulfovulcanus ferrireducens TaxID=2831190 RepID=UPI00207BBA85|nr:prepilin-type N-terminal cleavage/methylation domain-containing protein [Desulfovulcanus ferrireducens]MBT8764139.1 prepilin-type N-terminal cleavage/methylation domain-containing protein [Desulfovulcanus ferrireducens]